jgi:hypothetical protein
MKQSQMNRKHMLDTTLAFLDENPDKWQTIPKIGDVKIQLTGISQQIDTTAEDQEASQLAIGKMKAALKRTMAQKADILNDQVEVFAIVSGNDELAELMSDNYSSLYRMKNDDMMRRVKLIITSARDNQEALVPDYGVTEEQITDLENDYDSFLEINGKPSEFRVKSRMATVGLEELFTEANNLLSDHLDNLMKIFQRRDPNFYQGYLSAREVVDY